MYLILGLSSLWEKAAYGLIWQSTHSLLLLGSELQRSWIYFRAYVQIPNPINLSWLPLNTSLTKDKHFTRSAKTESTNLWLHRCFYAAQRCNYKLFCFYRWTHWKTEKLYMTYFVTQKGNDNDFPLLISGCSKAFSTILSKYFNYSLIVLIHIFQNKFVSSSFFLKFQIFLTKK